jgi:SAM-dependent methyltransferase
MSDLALHELKVARWLRGTGVEIGAFKSPLPGIRPFYVDRYATFAGEPTGADLQGDACQLPFRDHSLDFVAACHVLEHLPNPIKALQEWQRVLRHRGIIYLVVPDRRHTFDHRRQPTSVEHLLEDYRRDTHGCDPADLEDFVQNLDWARTDTPAEAQRDAEARAEVRRNLQAQIERGEDVDLHHHAFDPDNLQALLERLRDEPETRFDWRIVDWAEDFPLSCPNGIFAALEVHHPWSARVLGWRNRQLTRLDPNYPVLATATRFASKRPEVPVSSSSLDPQSLAQQLDEVARREASFRLKTIQNFRELDQRLRETHARAEALSEELGQRNAYIHQLHLAQAEWNAALQERHADVAIFTQWLQQAEDERNQLRREVARMRASWSWKYGSPLRWWQRLFQRPDEPPAAAPAGAVGDFVYFLHTSPFRVYRVKNFKLRGWLFPRDRRPVSAIRVRVGEREFVATRSLPEPDVAQQHLLAGGPHEQPGFEVEIEISPGRQLLQLEALVDQQTWKVVLRTPIWSVQ